MKENPQTSEIVLYERYSSIGAVIIKPHAVSTSLDVPVTEYIFEHLDGNGIEPITTVYRNTGSSPCCNQMIEMLYYKDRDKRYFPILRELYTGEVVIHILGSSHLPETTLQILQDLKGAPHVVDSDGDTVIEPTGVRGVFMPQTRFIAPAQIEVLGGMAYKEAVAPMINNIIHVPDYPSEVAMLLSMIMQPYDFENLGKGSHDLMRFMESYLKSSYIEQ